jgi:putative transposase
MTGQNGHAVPLRMAPKSTPSFVGEFPLDIDSSAATQLDKCLRAHGNLYNACLGEARNRAQRMREHPSWKAARALPKKTQEGKKARSAAFAACNKAFFFSAYSLQKFALTCRDACGLKDHIGGADLQATSDRAFKAVKHWVLGIHGKPRMKPTRAMRSISGKNNAATIRLRRTRQGQWQVMARGLVLPLLVKSTPSDTWQTDALASKVKYVRLVRRSLRHKLRWFA